MLAMPSPHVVRRQVLEIGVPSQEGAHALQDEVGRLYHERVVPALDRALSRHSPGGEVLRLDRLELDLGVLDRSELGEELVRRTEERLAKVLEERLGTLGDDPEAVEHRLTAEAAGLRWLRAFLETGRLPWWAPESASADPEAALSELVETAPGRLAETLRQAASPRVARRLERQFSTALRARLVAVLTADRPALAEVVDDWQLLLSPDVLSDAVTAAAASAPRRESADPEFVVGRVLFLFASRPVREHTVEAVSRDLAAVVTAESRLEPELVLRRLVNAARRVLEARRPLRVWLEGQEHTGRMASESSGEQTAGASSERIGRRSLPYGEGPRSQVLTSSGISELTSRDAPAPSGDDGDAAPVSTAPEVSKAATPRRSGVPGHGETAAAEMAEVRTGLVEDEPGGRAPSLEEGEEIFLDDAGLVILAPYLSSFFGKLGLVEGSSFFSTEAQERAVLLLGYLARATTEISEHLLALDKLLCGWPLEEPVVRQIELTEQEKEESRELLEAVAGNWPALGRTSAEGLRTSFLAREGRLSETGQGWKLTVPRTGYDVLLDQLPWGIGLVVLPWMNRPLFVEW